MVGNDMVLQAGRQPRPVRRPVYRRSYAFPNRSVNNTREYQSYVTPQPELTPATTKPQTFDPVQYSEPLSLVPPMLSATAAETESFAVPAIEEYEDYREPFQLFTLFTRQRVMIGLIIFSIIAAVSVSVLERHQIFSTTSHLQSDAVQLIQKEVKHQPKTSAANPQQLIIHSADYYNAMTALMTQPVSIAFGANAQTTNVSTSMITNWINSKNAGGLTYFSVNENQIADYVKNLVTTLHQSGQQVAYSQSIVSHIANNLLKAKGMTVYLPTN